MQSVCVLTFWFRVDDLFDGSYLIANTIPVQSVRIQCYTTLSFVNTVPCRMKLLAAGVAGTMLSSGTERSNIYVFRLPSPVECSFCSVVLFSLFCASLFSLCCIGTKNATMPEALIKLGQQDCVERLIWLHSIVCNSVTQYSERSHGILLRTASAGFHSRLHFSGCVQTRSEAHCLGDFPSGLSDRNG